MRWPAWVAEVEEAARDLGWDVEAVERDRVVLSRDRIGFEFRVEMKVWSSPLSLAEELRSILRPAAK